jgi:hypothetical protein
MKFLFYITFKEVQHKLDWNFGSVLKLLLCSSTAFCYQKFSSDISYNFINDCSSVTEGMLGSQALV